MLLRLQYEYEPRDPKLLAHASLSHVFVLYIGSSGTVDASPIYLLSPFSTRLINVVIQDLSSHRWIWRSPRSAAPATVWSTPPHQSHRLPSFCYLPTIFTYLHIKLSELESGWKNAERLSDVVKYILLSSSLGRHPWIVWTCLNPKNIWAAPSKQTQQNHLTLPTPKDSKDWQAP